MALRFLRGGYFAGKVGIGTASPTSSLTISSSTGGDHTWDESGILIQNLSTTTGESAVVFKNSGTAGTGSNYWFTGLNQSNIYRLAYGPNFENGYTFLQLSSLGALTLDAYDSTNNTGTPTYLLGTDASGNVVKTNTVPGSDTGPYVTINTDQTITSTKTFSENQLFSNNTELRWLDSGSTERTVLELDSNDDLYVGKSGGGNLYIVNGTGYTTAVTIDETQNVGIGTETPGNKLAVQSSFTTSTSDLFVEINSGHEASGGSDLTGKAGVLFKQAGSGNVLRDAGSIVSGRESNYSTDNQGDSYLSINTAVNSVNTEKIRITSGGKVGIGNDDPYLKLHVTGDTRVQGNLMVGDASRANTPAAVIHIKSSGTNAKLRIEDSDNANQYWDFLVDQGNALYFNEDTDTRVTFKEGGNVGIGTTSPGSKLHIYDSITKTAANPNTVEVFHNGNVTTNGIYPVAGLFTQQVSGGANSFATGIVGVADKKGDYGYIARGVQGIGKLSGNITVNNADMQYMGVEGRIEMEGSNSVNLDDRAYSFYGTAEIDSGSHLKEYHGLYLNTPTNNGTILNKYGISQVDANSKNYFAGNVGIGTPNPSSNLDIENASGVTIDINSSSGDGMFRFQDNGTTKWAIGRDNTQQNFVFSNSAGLASDNVLTLAHSTGNVGIGTTGPDGKLTVSNGGAAGLEFFPEYTTNNNLINNYNRSNATYVTLETRAAEHYWDIGTSNKMSLSSSGNLNVNGEIQGDSFSGPGEGLDNLLPVGYYATTPSSTGVLIKTNIVSNNYGFMFGELKLEQFNFTSTQTVSFSATVNSNGTVITKAAVADIAITIKLFVYGGEWWIWVPTATTYITVSAFIYTGAGYQGQYKGFNEVYSVIGGSVPSTGVTGSVDIVADVYVTTGSAGGSGPFLPLAGGTMTGSIKNGDGVYSYWGTGDDLQIGHDGSNSYIIDRGIGDLLLYYSDDFVVSKYGTSEISIRANQDSSVELFFDNTKKFQTTGTGVAVDGAITITDTTGTRGINRNNTGYNLDLMGGTNNTDGAYISLSGETRGGAANSYNGRMEFYSGGSGLATRADALGDIIFGTKWSGGFAQFLVLDSSSGDATFSNNVTASAVTATTFSGDLNGTINTVTTAVTKPNTTDDNTVATTAFVKNLIAELPAGLIYKGTWDADTNTPTLAAGGGEISEGTTTTVTADKLIDSAATFTTDGVAVGDRARVENVNGVSYALVTSVDSQTQLTLDADIVVSTTEVYIIETPAFLEEGNYYIVSVDGATDLNGITDWKVGDWVVASSTNEWQKIDNSSVLDGEGTGQTISLWSGAGNSNTLTNSIITQQSDDQISILGSTATTGQLGQLTIFGYDDGDSNTKYIQTRVDNGGDAYVTASGPYLNLVAANYIKSQTVHIMANDVFMYRDRHIRFLDGPGDSWNDVLGLTATTDIVQFGAINSFNSNVGEVAFYSANTENMRLDIDGNLGIGTTNPSYKLEVQGPTDSQGFVNDEGGNKNRLLFPKGGSYNGGNATTGAITVKLPVLWTNTMLRITLRVFDYSQNESFDVTVAGYNYVGNGSGGSWVNTSAWISSQSDIDKNFSVRFGNDGTKSLFYIGELTSSWSYLKVNIVDVELNHAATVTDWSTTAWSISMETTAFANVSQTRTNCQVNNWKRNGQDVYYGSGTGNVGIGTTNPLNKLFVSASTAGDYAGFIENTNSTNGYGLVARTAHTGTSAYAFAARAGTSDIFVVRGDGNVGIGTTSPSRKLHVHADSGSAYLQLTQAATGTTSNDGFQISMGAAQVNFINRENGNMVFETNNTEKMRITNTGNVGIGTTSPDYKLDVDGTFGVSDLPFNTDSVSALVADEITGVELVTNGDFSNGQTGWSFQTGWAVSNGGATVSTAGVTSRVAQTLSYVANISTTTKFRYKFEITNITAGSLRLFVNKPTFTEIANVNAVGKYEYDVEVNTGSNGIFYLYSTSSSGNTFQGTVTNVSVKEITPVSNQIQKRELGTGAFGPTPVGAYLPLTAGSGSPLTGTLYGTSTNYSGSGDYAGSLTLGTGASTQEAHLQIGQGRTGNGYSYIDLIGDATYTDYGLRVIRNNTGANTTSAIIHRGTGNLEISTVESASVLFKTNNTSAFSLTNTQNAIFEGYVGIGGTNPGANLEIRGTVNTDDCKIYLKENDLYGAYFKYDGDLNRGYIGGITGTTSENAVMSWSRAGSDLKLVTSGSTAVTIDSNRDVTFAEDITIKDVLLSNQVNTDIDTGAEVVAQVAHATYTAAFFDFVVKKGTNVRSGTVYACHDGDTTPLVEFTETSTNDLGDTSDVTLSVDISGANMRLLATVTSDDWSVKSLIRAI